ncbi:MAG: histidine phosphatase family protein [Bacteroidetes bacterium SW_9_63_38]|nr:MAG: histidine phosphatase family protein [Bacteroidetes bacterium SW_9_63_38]
MTHNSKKQILWIARHANREDFANPGWGATADRPHDPGLSTDGRKQAQKLGRRVATLDVDRIVASPFLRTVQTAHHVAEATDDPVSLEPGLGEWANPDWFDTAPEPLPFSELAARYVRLVPDCETCREPSFPESKHESLARLGATAQCLTDRYPNETLLLIGHGITVLGVLHGLIGSDVPDPGCPLASLTQVIRSDGEWAIRTRNDTSHLENGARATDRLA